MKTIVKITTMGKQEEDKLKVVDTKFVKIPYTFLRERRDKEFVNEAPTQFRFNQFYVLRNLKRAWVFVEEEKEDEFS